jgi:acyl dehydratase
MKKPLAYSDVESRRFDLAVYRGAFADEFSPNDVVAQLFRDRVDIAIIRIPSHRAEDVVIFERKGIPTITADTLVYYSADLKKAKPTQLRNSDLDFEHLGSENSDELDAMVKAIFSSYENHYSANPLLRVGLLPGYVEWARSFAGGSAERFGWLVRRQGKAVAFATCSKVGDVGEGVLYGVMPEGSGGGVYGDLIRFTQRALMEMGCRVMKVSTQVQNFAVQKVWAREGFVMREAFSTVHLNSMLSASMVPVKKTRLVFSHDDLAAFGAASGDLNPVHFDDEEARALGFEERIAHGVLASAFLSKYYGTEFPGKGTIFASSRFNFSRPIYCGREYSMEIRFPFHDPETGRWTSVAQVFDPAGEQCLLAYCDLVNRVASPV